MTPRFHIRRLILTLRCVKKQYADSLAKELLLKCPAVVVVVAVKRYSSHHERSQPEQLNNAHRGCRRFQSACENNLHIV